MSPEKSFPQHFRSFLMPSWKALFLISSKNNTKKLRVGRGLSEHFKEVYCHQRLL